MKDKVLLIDDQQEHPALLPERLRQRGIEVSISASSNRAISTIPLERFDAVLLDMQGVERGGMQLLEKLLATEPGIQVIILSAHPSVADVVKAIKAGAMEYLEKPVNLDILCEKIREARNQHQLLVEKQHLAEIEKIMARKPW